MESIGDRMKQCYERPSRHYLVRRVPVVIRVDGKSFHQFTKGFERPFDQSLIDSMVISAQQLSKEMQGFKFAYAQSDEVSFLLTDYDEIQTDAWFDYNQSKLESVTASMFTYFFNQEISKKKDVDKPALFDARAFNIPEHDMPNYFVWRQKDWYRNSLNMYCSSFFSHKNLQGKNNSERHEMLYNINKNWTKDLDDQKKNGTWIFPSLSGDFRKLDYDGVKELFDKIMLG